MTLDNASRRARTAACMILAGALTQCSATPPPPPVNVAPPTPVVVAAETPPDLSAAPAPDTMVLTIRSPSPRGAVRHLGERLGLGELVNSLEEQVPSIFGDDAALTHAIDLDAPADVVLYLGERDRPRLVIAFGALPMPRAEDALSQGHRLTPLSNGVRRIERVPAPEGNAAPECALAPAYGTDPRAARIVCADRFEHIEAALPYLTRTLPRTALAADAGDLVIDVTPEQLRAHYGEDLRRTTERMVSEFASHADPADAALVEQVRAWLRDQLARSLNQGLADLQTTRLALRFSDGATRLHGEVGFRAVGAPLVERFFGAVHDAHPSPDLVRRLSPGATSYFAGAGSIAPLRPELEILGPVVTRLVTADAHLPAPDVTALRAAIGGVFRLPGYDHFTSAGSSTVAADGTRWTLATYQLDAPAAPSITQYRALITALRRPAIARYVNSVAHVNLATIRTPPTPGLPAGTLYAVLPLPAGGSPDLRQFFRTGAQLEVLLVPDGNNLWFGYGANVLAHYREARANHAAPAEIPGLTADHVIFAGTTLPLGLAHLLGQIDPQLGRNVERGLQNTPNGNAPMTFSLTAQQGAEGASLAGDFAIPDSVLHAVGAMFRQSP